MRRDVPVCQVCKDPIWSYICVDCLGRDIINWLPSSLAQDFSKFHDGFTKHFDSNLDVTFETCVKCNKTKEANTCPFCYIVEAFHWIKERDTQLAYTLYKMLPLANDWRITHLHGCVWKEGYRPLGEVEDRKTHLGICDNCGEYSDELVQIDDQWVCKECGN